MTRCVGSWRITALMTGNRSLVSSRIVPRCSATIVGRRLSIQTSSRDLGLKRFVSLSSIPFLLFHFTLIKPTLICPWVICLYKLRSSDVFFSQEFSSRQIEYSLFLWCQILFPFVSDVITLAKNLSYFVSYCAKCLFTTLLRATLTNTMRFCIWCHGKPRTLWTHHANQPIKSGVTGSFQSHTH